MPFPLPLPEVTTPTGFDRATGLLANDGQQLPGTPDPAGQTTTVGGSFQEMPDSPSIERGEQATIVHKFNVTWDEGFLRLAGLGRGLLQTDSYGNTYRILSSRLDSARGGRATLTVTSEAITFDTPPDEFSCSPVELGINIIKYPRYLYALLPQPADSDETVQTKQDTVSLIQLYMDAPTPPQKSGVVNSLTVRSGTQTSALSYANAAAQEIIQKLWLQEDSPYIVGYQITFSQYYYQPQYLNPGGYIESPIQGGVPSYFLSPDNDNGTSTIFDNIAKINPQSYQDQNDGGLNISWLRKADVQEFQRTWTKVTRTWLGAPLGHWDSQIYSQFPRPKNWTTTGNKNPFILFRRLNNS